MTEHDFFKDGLSAYREGRIDDAIALLHNASEEDDQNPKIWNALGVALSKSGDLESAGVCFENAVMIDPGNLTYEKNLDSNSKKLSPKNITPKKIKSKSVRHDTDYEYGEPKATDSRPFWLGIIGMFIGGFVGILAMFIGALSAVFGGINFAGWGFVTILFSITGFIGSIVKPKQYGIIILVISGLFVLISTFFMGFIATLMFFASAYLLYRSIPFEFGYFLDFKENAVKKGIFTLGIIVLILIGFSGLTSVSTPTNASDYTASAATTSYSQPKADFSTVTHGSVMVVTKNWDEDAEDDGIVLYPDLLDSNDRSVKWGGVELPVDIEIWTTKYDSHFKEVKDQLVGSGSSTITSSDDSNMFMKGGVRVKFDQMSVPSGKTVGNAIVKVHLPDGRVIESEYAYTPLTP